MNPAGSSKKFQGLKTLTAKENRVWVTIAAAVTVFLLVVGIAQFTEKSDPAQPAPAGSAAGGQASEKSEPGNRQPEGSQEGANRTTGGEYTEIELVKRDPKDYAGTGDVNAPVTLLMWTDLRCPYCAVFDQKLLPTLMEEYVKPGKIRLEARDIALFGEDSVAASAAAHAAGKQGKYFEFLDAVYSEAPQKGHPDMPRERLIHFARKAGVADIPRFTADMSSPSLRSDAESRTAEANSWGVNAVPFFVAGRQALSGAQPIEVFREYLDEMIAKAEA